MAERGEGRRSIRSNMSRPLQPDFQFRRDESSAVSNGSSELARPPSVRRPVLDSTEVPNLKTIGKLGGISLIYNTMTGIGVIQAASVFQQSGWLLVVVFFVVYMIVSGICGLFIVEAMQCIPGNRFFQGTVEFATLINFYFGPVAHAAGQFCLFGALQSLAVSSIIQSSQTMDNLLIDIAGRTCGIAFSRSTVFTTLCVSDHGTMISPFGSTYMLTTAGYLVVLSFVVPLCIFPLTEFVSVQIAAFFITLGIFAVWIVNAVLNGLHPSFVPVVGSTSGYAGLIGVVMLNYAYVQAIPSWVNVKRPEVNVQWSIWTANLIGLGTYVCIGLIPALAYIIPSDSNLVAVISLLGTSNKIFGYLFSLLVLMTSIPVFLSISQLNIIQNLRINRYLSVLACYALPWAVAIPFLTGGYLLLINIWGSLIFVSTANFVVPLGIYLKAITFRKRYNKERLLTPKQRQLLRVIHSRSGLGKPKPPFESESRSTLPALPQSFSEQHLSRNSPPQVPTVVVDGPGKGKSTDTAINPADSYLTVGQGSMQSLFHPLEDTLRPTNVGQIPPLLDPVDETVGSSVFLSVPSNGTRRPPNGDTSFSSTKGEIEHHSHRSTFSKANSTWSDWMNGVSPPSSPDIRENTPATPSKAARQAQRSKSIVQWLSNGSLTQLPTRSKSVVESVPWRSEDPPQIQGVFESMPNVQGRFDSSAELPVRRKEGRPDRQILGGPAAWRSTSFASPKPMSLFEIDPETEHYLYEDVPDPYDEDEGAGLNDLPLDDSLFRRFSHPDIGHDSVQFDEIDAFEARLNTGRNNKQEPSPDVPRVFRNSAFQPFRKPTRGYSVPLVVVTDSPERRPEHDDAPNFQFFPEKRVVVMEPEEVGERAAPFARGNQQPKGIQAVHLAHITNAGSLTANSMSSLLNPKHDSVALPIGFLAPLHSESPESAAGESSQVPVSRSCSLHLPVLTLAELSSEAVCASPVSSRCSSSPDDEEAQKIRSALPRLGFSVDSSSDPHAKDTAVLHHPSLASRYAPHEDSVSRRLSTPQVRFLTTSTVMEFQPMQHLAIGQPVLPDSRTAEYDSKVKESDATLNATSGVASACFEVEQEPVSRTEQNSLAVPLAVPLSLHTSNKESGSAATTGCDGSSRRQRSLASSPQSEVDSAQFLTAIDVNTYPLFGAPLISSSRAPTVGTGSTRGSIATAKTRKGELLPQHHRSPSSSSREPVAHGPERQEQQSIYSEARSRVESIATSISKNGSPVKPIHPSIAAGRDKSPRPQSTTSRRASGPPAGTGGAGAKRPTRPRWPIGTLPKRMMSSATDTESRVILDDGASMPVNQFYASVSKRSPPFRSLPKGFPVSPWTVAVVCLVITCASTLANLIYVVVM